MGITAYLFDSGMHAYEAKNLVGASSSDVHIKFLQVFSTNIKPILRRIVIQDVMAQTSIWTGGLHICSDGSKD